MLTYLKDPEEIYRRSFETVRAETDLSRFPEDIKPVVVRLVHACGNPAIAADLRISGSLYQAVRTALSNGGKVLCDVEMARHAIIARRLPPKTEIICTLNNPQAARIGRAQNITRSAAAVELWAPHLKDAVVVIGNAPTALFRLLEMIDVGAPKPAAIIAFPVGFIGAAESKGELDNNPRAIPYATLLGRAGGSAMAGAALNAIYAGAR